MKAEELMVGDWFEFPMNQKIQIKSIDKVNETDTIINRGKFDDLFFLDDIKPILLTPEMLEKNGFEYDEEGRVLADNLVLWIDEIRYVEYNPFNRAFLILGESSTFDGICNYVHELQHALRLCGIDKQIEL